MHDDVLGCIEEGRCLHGLTADGGGRDGGGGKGRERAHKASAERTLFEWLELLSDPVVNDLRYLSWRTGDYCGPGLVAR